MRNGIRAGCGTNSRCVQLRSIARGLRTSPLMPQCWPSAGGTVPVAVSWQVRNPGSVRWPGRLTPGRRCSPRRVVRLWLAVQVHRVTRQRCHRRGPWELLRYPGEHRMYSSQGRSTGLQAWLTTCWCGSRSGRAGTARVRPWPGSFLRCSLRLHQV